MFTTSQGHDTMDTLGPKIESNLGSQLRLPLIDAAALVFYSGNLVVDLLMNFMTAIPQMFTLLVEGIFTLMPIDANLQKYVKLFVLFGNFILGVVFGSVWS